MTKTERKVLIVGGGIAGPVLASALARAGIASVIAEARGELSEGDGAFLGVAPNGMNVLASLGIAERVLAAGHAAHGFAFRNAEDRSVGTIDGRADVERYGHPLTMIRRGVLSRILLDDARSRGVPLLLGARLRALDTSDPHAVIARFEDGREEIAGCVVGCDGLRSRTRALAFPDLAPPAYTGLLDFGGYARPTSELPLPLGWNVMVFGARAFFGAFRTPDEVWWFHNGADPEPVRDLDPEARRARILAEHARDPAWIGELVRSTDEVRGPWPLHEVTSMERWHVGRVGVIGDAAHATSPSGGQGASLAMEDALLLARCLRDHRDPDRAFTELERLRRPRVADAVAQSRRNASRKALTSPIAIAMRDLAMPLFVKLGAGAQQRAYGYRIEW